MKEYVTIRLLLVLTVMVLHSCSTTQFNSDKQHYKQFNKLHHGKINKTN